MSPDDDPYEIIEDEIAGWIWNWRCDGVEFRNDIAKTAHGVLALDFNPAGDYHDDHYATYLRREVFPTQEAALVALKGRFERRVKHAGAMVRRCERKLAAIAIVDAATEAGGE